MSKIINALDVIHESEPSRTWPRVRAQWTIERRSFFDRKYTVDRWVGRLLLVLLSPVILLLWATVKLTSKGPGFYRQTRVGLSGQEFELFKLRSMRMDAERGGQAIWCSKHDDRMTWLGKILRKLHLDELPQLFNVARGEMSLIGPRPERPMICEELAEEIVGYYDRVVVKPGITGLSQINLPPDTSLEDVRRKQILDLQYINETNGWLEFRILSATGLRMIGIKGETVMKWMRLCRLSLIADMGMESEPEPHVPEPQVINTLPREKKRRRPLSRPSYSEAKPVYSLAYDTDSELDLGTDSVDTASSSGIGLPR